MARSIESVIAVRTPAPARAIDLSNDGALLVAACDVWGKDCRVLVARTDDGAVVDAFGEEFHHVAGVALCGESLYFVGVKGPYQSASALYRRDLRARSNVVVEDLGSGAHF